MPAPTHEPVLLDRVIALLDPCLRDEASGECGEGPRILIDATVGLGGHAQAVLERYPAVRVIGLDRDPEALSRARDRLAPHADRFTAVHAVYDQIAEVLLEAGLETVDAVFFDLGVSSMQLDVEERGFAYAVDAPLDMRMDNTTGRTAAEVLNTYDGAALTRLLRDYGEERFAAKIARAVVRRRERTPFTTSGELVELLYAEIPAPARRRGGHPAKRTFQALRMEVNDELAVLRRAIPAALDAIGVGGRVVVEAYHSLEDRIVKQAFSALTRSTVPEDLPFVPAGQEPAFRLVTRGAEKADAGEAATNPRAASVRLRAVERLRETPATDRGAA